MKKIGLIIFVMCLCFTEAFAEESFIFGPDWAVKERGKAKEVIIPVFVELNPVAEYELSIRSRQLRTKLKIVLNGNEVVTSKTAFVNGMIRQPVNLIDGNNELKFTMLKGEVDIAIVALTAPPETRTLHCVVMDLDGMLVGEGINVRIRVVDTGELIVGVTGIDGAYKVIGLPLKGTVIINVTGEGVAGSLIKSLKSKKDSVVGIVHLYHTGIGKISGHTDPNVIVQAVMQAPPDHSISNVLYMATTTSDDEGAFELDCLPLNHFRLQAMTPGILKTGSKSGQLTEAEPEIEMDIETKSPSRINPGLVNGDFQAGTTGWETEGIAGISWQPRYFDSQEGDPCDPDPDLSEDFYCGSVASYNEYEKSSLSQTFIVPKDAETLRCRARYITESYRYGPFSISDDFSIRLEKLDGTQILAEGSENTYPFDENVDISAGLVGMSEELQLRFDLKNLQEEVVKIIAEIRDSGTIFTSALEIAEVEINREGRLLFHSDYSLALPTMLEFQAGMAVDLVFVNTNPLFVTAISIRDVKKSSIRVLAIAPNSSDSIRFDSWGCEPVSWGFDIRSRSALNQNIFCKVYSTWVEGMPINE